MQEVQVLREAMEEESAQVQELTYKMNQLSTSEPEPVGPTATSPKKRPSSESTAHPSLAPKQRATGPCCSFCEGAHISFVCPIYATHDNRIAVVNRKGLCTLCIGVHPKPCKAKLVPCSFCGSASHRAAICVLYKKPQTRRPQT